MKINGAQFAIFKTTTATAKHQFQLYLQIKQCSDLSHVGHFLQLATNSPSQNAALGLLLNNLLTGFTAQSPPAVLLHEPSAPGLLPTNRGLFLLCLCSELRLSLEVCSPEVSQQTCDVWLTRCLIFSLLSTTSKSNNSDRNADSSLFPRKQKG